LVDLVIEAVFEKLDKGPRLTFGRRMGSFEAGDLVGLDISLSALITIYEESKDLRYYPPQMLRRKVRGGDLCVRSIRPLAEKLEGDFYTDTL
jgi:3-hydroxybutyryl-CoA dehydrogenase